MASHRMPDSDRPRRPVPAWVTTPPDGAPSLEARPAPASAPAPGGPSASTPAGGSPGPASASNDGAAEPASIATLVQDDVAVPDYPPQEHLLPPAPTSPSVHTVPFDTAAVSSAPAPVSPIDAAPPVQAAQRAPQAPVPSPVPAAGQPRFSVPGLEHVVVEGTEPEPVGPIGYRTPRRFAHQQAAAALVPAMTPPSSPLTRSAAAGLPAPVVPVPPLAPAPPVAEASVPAQAEPGLQTELLDQPVTAAATPEPRRALGATPGAVVGAVAGIATLGLATWWFTAPATVHGAGVVLGLLALLLSIVTLRNRAATWQRPVALLGAVLGGVGTLVLLWAVASALLPLAGVTLPDLTGSGTTPTLAP